MKAFSFLLLAACLGATPAGAQGLRGGFVLANTPECGEFFYFAHGRFLNYGACDTGPYYGNGTFQIKADSLLLRFDDWQPPFPDVAFDPGFQADSATSDLTVRVVDAADGETLPGVSVRSETTPSIGASTDAQGLARIVNPMPSVGKLSVSSIGFEPQFIEVSSGKGHHLLVKLHLHTKYHIAGNTRRSFLIKHSANHSLLFKINIRFIGHLLHNKLSEA